MLTKVATAYPRSLVEIFVEFWEYLLTVSHLCNVKS